MTESCVVCEYSRAGMRTTAKLKRTLGGGREGGEQKRLHRKRGKTSLQGGKEVEGKIARRGDRVRVREL